MDPHALEEIAWQRLDEIRREAEEKRGAAGNPLADLLRLAEWLGKATSSLLPALKRKEQPAPIVHLFEATDSENDVA